MAVETETKYKYTSVDGTATRTSGSIKCMDSIKCMGVKVAVGFLLLAVAFLAGRNSTYRLLANSSNSIANSVALRQDFKNSKLQVTVSYDGKVILVALPAKRLYGVYQIRQVNNHYWETSLLKEGLLNIRRLYFANHPQYGTLSTIWADRDLSGFDTANTIPTTATPAELIRDKVDGNYPVVGQGPFWPSFEYSPKIAISDEASPRIVLLSLDPDMTLRVYAKPLPVTIKIEPKSSGSNTNADTIKKPPQISSAHTPPPRYEQQGQIPCEAFGKDCLREFDYDDAGSILSYQWLDKSTVAVDMCTIGRCSIHIFREETTTESNSSWLPMVNFTRRGDSVAFTSRDDQQKMIQTELKHSRQDNLPHNLTIRTWSNQDNWKTPTDQTIPLPKYELLENHYLSISRQPMVSQNGSVLCVIWSDNYSERPVATEVLTEAWIYHWDSSASQWNLYRSVELGQDISQVELSGNGQRLILFQKDYSFSVEDL